MTDIILLVVLAVIIGSAARYVYKSRKSGVKCIGCPNGSSCSLRDSDGCHCGEL